MFSKEPTAKQTAILPAAGSAVGVLAARFLLMGQPQQTVFRLTGALLLILSLLISIPGINILKAVLCKELMSQQKTALRNIIQTYGKRPL